MAQTINELQDAVIEEFSDFDDWMDKYQMLIDLGNDLEPLDEKYKPSRTSSTVARAVCGYSATMLTESWCLRPTAMPSS